MKQDSENPQTNNLGAGLDEKEIHVLPPNCFVSDH